MIVAINENHPEPRKVARAVEALEKGDLIAYPTDTVYGLGCDLMNKKAIDKLYVAKGMDRSKPLALICADLADIARYAVVENHQYRVLKRLLPGPYCFLLEATREVPRLVQSKQKTVGIRVPKNEVILAVVRALGRPVLSTTANKPHRPLSIPITSAARPSIAVCDQMLAVDKSRLGEFVGRVSDAELRDLNDSLRQILSL